jgi:hypothetical protein
MSFRRVHTRSAPTTVFKAASKERLKEKKGRVVIAGGGRVDPKKKTTTKKVQASRKPVRDCE